MANLQICYVRWILTCDRQTGEKHDVVSSRLLPLKAFRNSLPQNLTILSIPCSCGLPYHYVRLYRPVDLLLPLPSVLVLFQTRRFPPSALVFHISFYVICFLSLFALRNAYFEVFTLPRCCTAYVGRYERFGSTDGYIIQGWGYQRRMSRWSEVLLHSYASLNCITVLFLTIPIAVYCHMFLSHYSSNLRA